ncbi:MAG TPA: cobalt-precorrin-6A reductase [Streptosporangiaceae bacterium]|nr:cobalt-precorrin-6A reductase [Streptosporangiaceae bacterium]
MTAGPPATVLILGGTGEARELAGLLDGQPGLRVISSLAGRVADPALPAGEVRIGGFGGVAGLAGWLRDSQAAAVVDATHPFAEKISANAAAACAAAGTPLLSLVREPWTAGPGDHWHEAGSLPEAAGLLPELGRRVFLTTGRQGLAAFAGLGELWFLIRCVDPPAGPMPAARQVILARGPYDAAAERDLMGEHQIDVLVTKNSGGPLTAGKLAAARELGVAVVMVRRPPLPDVRRCSSAADATSWVAGQLAPGAG